MGLMRILAATADGGSSAASFGIAASARDLAPQLLSAPEDTTSPAFFAQFLKDIVTDDAVWEQLGDAITSGAYVPGSTPLILDCSWEGADFRPDVYERLHAGLARYDIPLSTVAYIQMCRLASGFYDAWADAQGFGEKRMKVYAHWGTNTPIARSIAGIYGDDEGFEKVRTQYADARLNLKHPVKRFLCLNNLPKPERTATTLLLSEKAPALSYLSHGRFTGRTEDILPWVVDRENLPARLDTFAALTPMVLDVETGSVAARGFSTYGFDPQFYRNSAISVVTESEMSSKGLLRLTEKTFKPLGMFHVVIVCGNKGALGALRDMGFRSFAPLIDESYDLIDDGPERLKAVHAEVAKLAAMSDDAFVAALAGVWDNVTHNAVHLRNMLERVQAIELEKTLRRIRADFAPVFGYAREATLLPVAYAVDWDSLPATIVDEKVAVRLSPDKSLIQITQLGEEISNADVFVHVHANDDVKAATHAWPRGRRSMSLGVQASAERVEIGQFTAMDEANGVRYTDLWRAELWMK
jgi:hypothetical protein